MDEGVAVGNVEETAILHAINKRKSSTVWGDYPQWRFARLGIDRKVLLYAHITNE